MKAITVTIGMFAWIATAWHRLWTRFHGWRMRVHSDKEDGHKAQADSLAEAARSLAPPKAKVIAPKEVATIQPARGPLTVLADKSSAVTFHPRNDADRAGAVQETRK